MHVFFSKRMQHIVSRELQGDSRSMHNREKRNVISREKYGRLDRTTRCFDKIAQCFETGHYYDATEETVPRNARTYFEKTAYYDFGEQQET